MAVERNTMKQKRNNKLHLKSLSAIHIQVWAEFGRREL
jgi:ribosomal protein L32